MLAGIGYAVWSRLPGDTGSIGAGSSATTTGTTGGASPAPATRASQDSSGDPCAPAAADGIPAQPHEAQPLPDPAGARELLASLVVAPRSGGDSYCRGRFGPDSWPDLDRNGCSTRQDVLVRQAATLTTRRIAAHDRTCDEAVAGTWVDPYTAETLTFTNLKDSAQAAQLQIDHVVPLYNAWVSGARDWTDSQRVVFANDLASPELRAVGGHVNFAKDRSGPESWVPVAARQCDYARAFVAVKAHYRLTVTSAERDALARLLGTCS